jgi:hypothetical protein
VKITQFEAVGLRWGADQRGFVPVYRRGRALSRLPANFIDELIVQDRKEPSPKIGTVLARVRGR